MFRLIVSLLLLLAIGAPSYGDEKVAINPVYLPNSSYTIKQSSVNQLTMALANPFVASEDLRQRFPFSAVVDDDREISIVTGKVTDEKKFPITMEFKKGIQLLKQNDLVKSMGGSLGKLVGVRVHGTIDADGDLSILKITGTELLEEERNVLMATFEAAVKSLKTAVIEPIGIGERCTKTVPLDIPIPGIMNFGMEMTTTYELMDVKDGIANFDTTYIFTLAADAASDEGLNIRASGKGTGKIVYDVKKRVQLQSQDRLEIDMTVPVDSTSIHITSKTEDSTVTEVRESKL